MNPTVLALTGYIVWFMFLIGWIVTIRVIKTLSGSRAANSFLPDGSDGSPFYARLSRAHINCCEGFPFIGGLLILALVTSQTQLTNPLAAIVLAARIAQSVTHLISAGVLAVQVRFFFFLIQLVICIYWGIKFIMLFGM